MGRTTTQHYSSGRIPCGSYPDTSALLRRDHPEFGACRRLCDAMPAAVTDDVGVSSVVASWTIGGSPTTVAISHTGDLYSTTFGPFEYLTVLRGRRLGSATTSSPRRSAFKFDGAGADRFDGIPERHRLCSGQRPSVLHQSPGDQPSIPRNYPRTRIAEKRRESMKVDEWQTPSAEYISVRLRRSRQPLNLPSHGRGHWFDPSSAPPPGSLFGQGFLGQALSWISVYRRRIHTAFRSDRPRASRRCARSGSRRVLSRRSRSPAMNSGFVATKG